MIIDCHGHYTTAPKALEEYRKRQLADLESARLDIRVAPTGVSRVELARTMWRELRCETESTRH